MKLAALLRGVARETRSARGRLLFSTACLALGVAAVTGVAGLASAVEGGVRARARELLGADFAVSAFRPLPDSLDAAVAEGGAFERVDVQELSTVARAPREAALGEPDNGETAPASRLVRLHAVSAAPFYGSVRLDPPLALEDALTPDSLVAEPALLDALGLEVGEQLELGGRPYRIAAALLEDPTRVNFAVLLGPRVLLSTEALESTGLVATGSRVSFRALYRLPDPAGPAQLTALTERLTREVEGAEYLRFETWHDAQPRLRRSIDEVSRYLGLLALLSLLLGGTGVAGMVRAWIAGRTRDVAVLRAIGYRPRDVGALFLAEVALLAAVGSLLGALLGGLLPLAAGRLLPDFLPATDLSTFPLGAALRGVLLGTGVAAAFCLRPLAGLWSVPPARVLRADAEPLPVPRAVSVVSLAALFSGVALAAWFQDGELLRALGLAAGFLVLLGLLTGSAELLVRGARRIPRRGLPPRLAHALAALGRPGAGVRGAVAALGTGVLAVCAVLLAESRLASELFGALPTDAPSAFLVDVQPDQWTGVEQLLANGGASAIESVPVVMARLASVDGRSVRELAEEAAEKEGSGARWRFTREQRLTWMEELPDDNELVAGALWTDADVAEVSLEARFAEGLGATLGSRLVFDVQGVPLELRVTSLRTVRWQSFGINFFLVVEPGVLEAAPHWRLATAQLPAERTASLRGQLAQSYPNVTFLEVRELLDRVRALLEKLALAVRILGAFAAGVGVAILAGTFGAGAAARAGEAALWKALGQTRRGVAVLFAWEFALVGAVAGAVGALGAVLLVRDFETRLGLPHGAAAWVVPAASVACALLAVFTGLLANLRALRAPAGRVLREEA